ncbi:hypothetical protein V0M98_36725 (plasmid) [Pseudomonas silesiensis]|uniref:hypothetical protein n=1 Tax=Pseudomonas silesiensis TaxID=1853130 RepID=UPI0030D2E89C
MAVNMGRLETMMNHFLREGFQDTRQNRLARQVCRTSKLEIEKVDGEWSVTVRHDHINVDTVMVSIEDMMFWLYNRTFR